jgi:outer membrane protein
MACFNLELSVKLAACFPVMNSMNPKWSIFAATALVSLTAGIAQAEFVGFNLEASHWTSSLPGSVSNAENSSIDLVDDLNVDSPSQTSMVLILEHPIDVLPNVRYEGLNLDSSGRSSSDFEFNGEAFSSGNQVTSTFDLDQDDIVLYYELIDNRMNLDIGVDLKYIDGEVSLNGSTETSVDVNETIPLLYLSARYDLPYNGFYVGADINADIVNLGISDSSAQDSTIMMGYESRNGLGVEGGYKHFSLDLDDVNDIASDIEYDGIFLNGYYNF